jgi:hypothetical protein
MTIWPNDVLALSLIFSNLDCRKFFFFFAKKKQKNTHSGLSSINTLAISSLIYTTRLLQVLSLL